MIITKKQLLKLIREETEKIAISSVPPETKKAAQIARDEAKWWDGPVKDKKTGKQRRRHEKDADTNPEVKDRLTKYWKASKGSNYGYSKPWSAAFLSHALDQDPDFAGSKVHLDYMKGAARNRFLWDEEKETKSVGRKGSSSSRPDKIYKDYIAFKPGEYDPDIGDLVCNPRDGGYINFDPSKKKISIGDANHCDICLDDDCNTITGGNVGGDVCKDFKKRGLSKDGGCTSRIKPRGDYKMVITKNPERLSGDISMTMSEGETMKITRKQLRRLILNETQKSAGLPQDMNLEKISVDNQIVNKAREVYQQFGQIGPSGQEYSKYYLPPGGEMLLRILRNRMINIGRLMNPSNFNYKKVERDIARHRQSRLGQVYYLFGGRDRRYTSSSSSFSSDERANDYEFKWLEMYQEILGGTIEWDENEKLWKRN